MCCFSVASPGGLLGRLRGPRVRVAATNILARMVAPGVQGLAYGMDLATSAEVAMVLPLPVAPGRGEDAVAFVDLSAHPRMFAELAALFGAPLLAAKGGVSRGGPRLAVKRVGAFVASYVPTRADFARLDPRFRLPEALFDAVPAYADHGFAVFQLAAGDVTVHPMGLTFPTREPARLFFPTVHVHDGRFHAHARFDHALYAQGAASADGAEVGWGHPTSGYGGLVAAGQPIARRSLRGHLPNADTWMALAT